MQSPSASWGLSQLYSRIHHQVASRTSSIRQNPLQITCRRRGGSLRWYTFVLRLVGLRQIIEHGFQRCVLAELSYEPRVCRCAAENQVFGLCRANVDGTYAGCVNIRKIMRCGTSCRRNFRSFELRHITRALKACFSSESWKCNLSISFSRMTSG